MDNGSDHIQQLFRKGAELLQGGNAAAALAFFQNALNCDPLNAMIHLHTGAALHDMRRYEEAVASYRQAVGIAPNMGEAFNNMGNSLMALGRFAEAADSFSKSSDLLQLSPVPLAARATALQAVGRIAEAEADCRRAVKLSPLFAAAHWNLALNLLLQGRYEEGWQEYEWRWKKPDFTSPCRHTDIPIWGGSPLDGRTILLHAEQGFGDAIQFIRYAPLVAKLGGKVVVECHSQLVSLFQSVDGVDAVLAFGAPLPAFCCQAPLLSLPHIFHTTLQDIPSHCPYLSVSADYRNKWAKLTTGYQDVLRVGLAWAGKSYPDPLRSCRPEDLAPLAAIPGMAFYSLQVGSGAEQVISTRSGMPIIDLTSHISSFADTAALIGQLDLVISIDTAVAHLAGAMGKPAFIMLPFAPDWRWLLDRSDSPWYPTMQIFRQHQPEVWDDVIICVHAALEKLSGDNKKSFGDAPKD